MADELRREREPTIFASRLLLFFVAIVLFIALIFRQHELSLLTALVLLVVGGAKAWSLASLRRIRCVSRVDRRRLFPGEELTLETEVENAKLLPVEIRLHQPAGAGLAPVAGSSEPGPRGATSWPQGVTLLWHQRARFRTLLVAQRRGVHRVGPPWVESGDLFGIFRREKRFPETLSVLVYPRLVPVKPVAAPAREAFGALRIRSPIEDPVYVRGTRDYQPSRPARHIHWKSSARRLRLQEKVFEPSGQGSVLLALEVGGFAAGAAHEAFEATLEVVASLCLQLERRGYAVGLLCNGVIQEGGLSVLPASRGPRQLPSMLETLARLRMTATAPLDRLLRRSSALHAGASCLLFCYEPDDAALRLSGLCRERGVPSSTFAWRPAAERGALGGAQARGIDELRVPEGDQG